MIRILVGFAVVSCVVMGKIDHAGWVSLTYPMSPETPVYRGAYTPMKIDGEKSKATDSWPGSILDGTYVAFNYIEFYEHTGTHVDAPAHFVSGGRTEDELTWNDLTGPLTVVNVADKLSSATPDTDLRTKAEDFEKHVKKHGKINPNSFVILYTGWSKYYWTNATKYLENPVCVEDSAIEWLKTNAPDMMGFGMDAASPECMDNKVELFELHQWLLFNNKIIMENVSPGADELPAVGSDLMIFPMHLKDGTGSPARLVAVLPDKLSDSPANSGRISLMFMTCFALIKLLN